MSELMEWNWQLIIYPLMKVAMAFALAMPVAWDRERSTRIMGLRTFPLVALASCAFVLIARRVAGSEGEAQARIIQGLMSGIGFIGGGAILKEGASVRGTATAASIWTTGAVGAAVGYGRYEIAILVSVANFLTLYFLKDPRLKADKNDRPPEHDE